MSKQPKNKLNLRAYVRNARRDGNFTKGMDFTSASMDVMKQYNITEGKRQQLLGFMAKNVEQLKIKEYKKKVDPEYPKIVGKNTAHKDLLKHVDQLKTAPIGKYIQRDILKRTGMQKHQDIYHDTVTQVIKEFRNEWINITHKAGIDSRLQPLDHSDTQPKLPPYPFLGRTDRFSEFVRNRKRLEKRLFIQYPLMGKLSQCATKLPDLLVDMRKYRDTEYEIPYLLECFYDEIEKSIAMMRKFHLKVTKIVRNSKAQYPKDACAFARYQNTATVLLGIVISRLLRNSIEHIVEVTGTTDKVPYLKLNLTYANGLRLTPSAQETSEMYAGIVQCIVASGKDYLAVECMVDETLKDKYLPIYIGDDLQAIASMRIKANIDQNYAPINAYVDKIASNLLNLRFSSFSDKRSYEELCSNIDFYNKLMTTIEQVVSNEFYAIGALEQEDCKANLHQSFNKQIDQIAMKMIEQLELENASIIEQFVNLAAKARELPQTSEELVEQGAYMTWARTVLMNELTQRIQRQLSVICRLMDITTLSTRQIYENATMVNWIWDIQPILELNSTNYEAFKFEFEERLANAVTKINADIKEISPYLDILDYMNDPAKSLQYLHHMAEILVRIRSCEEKKAWINSEERTFKYPISPFMELEELKTWVYTFYHLVKLCHNWNRSYYAWMDGPFEFLDANYSEEYVEDLHKELIKMQKFYRNKLRALAGDVNARKFQGSVDDPDPSNQPAPLQLTRTIINQIKNFRPALTLMRIMCNPALLQRHWDEMSEIASFDLTPNAGTTLHKITLLDLGPSTDAYEIISSGAVKELQLITNLKKMISEWDDVRFKTSTYKDTGITILTSLDDIQVVLDDHTMKTLTMRGSVFVKPYEQQVKAWYDKLMRMNTTIDVWGKVQSQWLYLLPIFSSKDIVNQMPAEGILFKEVDSTYKRYMQVVAKDPRVITSAGAAGLLEALEAAMEMLDKINEGVAAYLEKKRLFFPRFFFLSNDEMLEILSETKDPLRVQPHLRKCFEAINRLHFDDHLQVHAMLSQENERVDFVQIVKTEDAGGSVEKWLLQVEEQMLVSVKEQLYQSWLDYVQKPRTQWMQMWPGQVVLAVTQIYWTAAMHQHLSPESQIGLDKYASQLFDQLQDTVALIRDPTLTNLARITIKALIVIDVHAKDVTADLHKQNVQSDTEFKWLCQLRYYWEEQCNVRMINATIRYACEYLGNSDRLVITPLTDRCYRTLIGAYHLHLNGAPEGPAGTGKTETTKDLAKALAVQCVVFNCSDGLDYKAMGKFFKGLASSGAWACFDEFNRIEIEVLSVVAQQILSIVQAVRANAKKFVFEGTELKLNPACYVCITMNPGYAGRSELPDNLKVLFRTVAMMVPDYAMIGEISLYSYGFMEARKLSVKIVTVYKLCSEQLSSQNHYDYGMRAVKSVLSACGNNKLAFPNENEDIILLRSILDINLAKFLAHDVPLFEGIISDLFPGIVLSPADYRVFIKCFRESAKARNLQPCESFKVKVIQTYEMMIVRHGFMLVGYPFAGKTSTLKVLGDTLTKMQELGQPQLKVQYQFINPKSITMGQLYGQFDPISYEWFDGVVATCFRNFVTDPVQDRKWIIFDGPVDAVWIENMNTVLDDNKKLCLMSGEVMAMTNSMSMIFEVMDLAQASPATVSRCGMIYLEPANLGWRPLLESWIVLQNPEWCGEYKSLIKDLFYWIVDPCLFFMKKHCRFLNSAGDINQVKNMYTMVQMILDTACAESAKKEDDFKFMRIWIEATFIMASSIALGSTLDRDSVEVYDEFCRSMWRNENPDHPFPASLEKLEVVMPIEGFLCNYTYVFRLKGAWKYYPEVVKNMRVEEAIAIEQVLVPTVDSLRVVNLLDMHIKYKVPFLLIGPTGTGKSYYIQDKLMNKLDLEKYEPSFITFTVKITANQTQEMVISKLNKIRRGKYGPRPGKHSIMFVDDMNMPVKDTYGAQPAIELLRQYFDHKNWYDLKDTSEIQINDVLIITAMGLVGGSRQDVYARFLRHFNLYAVNEFSEDSMQKIFSNVLLLAWKKNGFPSDVITVVNAFVGATQAIYMKAILTLRPTPLKSHYVFNLRDFARVIFGASLLRKDSAEDRRTFAKLWVHESLRVFYDRLIENEDRAWLYEEMRKIVRSCFKDQFEQVFSEYAKDANGLIPEEEMKKLMFGTYLDADATEDDVKYEEVPDSTLLFNLANNFLDEYNSTHKAKMEIVLFQYALEHLSKTCRVLAIPSGSALLVGVSGSGRQSLVRLATAIAGHAFFQPEISKNYGMNEWREDIKKVLKEAGGRGKSSTFLLSEGQIKDEGFLGDIDNLLNSGEVPNIYAIDERQEILEMVRLAAQGGNRNLDISTLAVFSYFIKRCKERLHIMLCFSPIGSSFRQRLRLFPSLVNCCTIDWYDDWPEESLEVVAHNWLQDINLPDEVKRVSVIACKHFHVVARQVSADFQKATRRKTYITSASYLELIKSFTVLTNKKQNEIMLNKNRYLTGLDKLQNAASQVAGMQKSLAEYQPMLLEMSKKANEMLAQIEKETKEVEKASVQVRKDEKVANVQAAASQALKRECEADLAEAIPVLEEALNALNTLKPTDITLVKSMKNPPEAIKIVMAAVCVMRDIKPDRINDPSTGYKILDYWGPSKRLLGDMNFLQYLKDYDKDNIKVEIMTKIRKEYLPNPLFKPNVVAKASSAAEGLCKWIIAMDMYDNVARVVAPKKAKLESAEREYAATMALLMEKKDELTKLEERLSNLNEKLDEAMAKQKEIRDNVENVANKLSRAEKLIGGLGGERTRWMAAADNLQLLYNSLAGDLLICCGVIAYLSPVTMPYRTKTISGWFEKVVDLKIPCSSHFDFTATLGSDIKIQTWCINNLPRDAFSIENAIIQDCSRRYSLLVDPQGQANTWIKKMEKKNELELTRFVDPNYMKILERCIPIGRPVLLENVQEDLEPPLDPILFKTMFSQGGHTFLSLGDNVIPFHKDFKFYLTSNLRNPHYLPEIFNKVTIINFSLTQDGLDDQLLGIVVAKERPDLQRQREELIMQSAQNKAALARVEENILKTLSESEGDILEDESAIEVLDYSKVLSMDIIAKQKHAIETEKKIEGFRLDYHPMSEHSAGLYYCISDLPNVDPMYQFSLNWFINLYVMSIENANKSRDLEKRLKFLKDTFTYNLYANVCRSLFEKDKLMFSFILCCTILLAQQKLQHTDFKFLLTGGINVENPHENPAKDWLSDKSWNEICRASELPHLHGLKEHIKKASLAWKLIYDDNFPLDKPLPAPFESSLTAFDKLICIRLIRPDMLAEAMSRFVTSELGVKFTQPPPFDISKSYEDSTCITPLVFILSPGNDPLAALWKFAEAKEMQDNFKTISLGQGQGPVAAELIERAQEEGGWICLQNCHLAESLMPMLEKLWEEMDMGNTNEIFRLWLTSYPSSKFPIAILQNAVKMTNEPPTGLHQNLLRSYMSEPIKDPDFYAGCPGREEMFQRLLYGIVFFHAVVQERRCFGPLGWNIPYGFNESDMDISVRQLQMFVNEYAENPYEGISYLTGECNYGGRVTDDWDRRLIVTILLDFLNQDLVENPDYMFVTNVGDAYGLPRKTHYDDMLDFIQELPKFHSPEVFGLHRNAGITRDLQTSYGILNAIILVQGEDTSAGGLGSDSIVTIICNDILSKLPKPFNIENAILKYPVEYSESMNTVLVQEMERFNKLLREIVNSLQDIVRAIKGLIVMTPQLEVVYSSVLLGRVPAQWNKVSYPSLKSLPNYIADFIERVKFLDTWFKAGKPPSFWLSGFFFTQAFLTGAKQNYARKYKIPIDQLTFDFNVLKVSRIATAPVNGVYTYGPFTDGARWDVKSGVLRELHPKVLYDIMPVVWIKPILANDYDEGKRYRCPLYKTSERRGILSTTGHSTNYVLPYLLETDKPSAHWVKRSVALLCQLD